MVTLVFNTGYKEIRTYIWHYAMCCQIKCHHLACVKTDVEAHETIWNCGLVYSIDREKPHLLITFSFAVRICSEKLNVHMV